MEASEFGKYLRHIRKLKKMTIRQVELYSNVSNAYISQLERGERGIPSPAIIEKLSKALGVDYEEMMEKAGHIKEKRYSYGLEPIDFANMVKLPILGTIRAGEPIYMNENIEGYEFVSPDVLRGRKGFILKVRGDSMSGDRIHDGDMVVCIVQEECEPSDITVVAIDGEEATLKRVKCQGDTCVLSSSNPSYEAMIFPAKDIHILGVVEMVMIRMRK